MGIGNTTSSSALAAVLLRLPADEVTGRGAGADDDLLATKTEVVRRAADRVRQGTGEELDPFVALQELGGAEIGALAGFVVGGAAAGVPVVVDGFIAGVAALLADRLAPGAAARCVAAHRSVEPGATAVLAALHLVPLLDLGLRLGEATGALLAVPLLRAATAVLAEMGTIDEVDSS
jgi:nicotinate-nucleotide--dimethylbenzimidazole phosphoribosyltransferase